MPFFLDGNPTQGEISEAVNYLLSNFGQNVSADPTTGQITGPTGAVSGYLYKYLAVKYADSFDGTLNFSNVPTGRLYYGVRNTNSSVESTNPADYIWYLVAGGFGSTKYLWYITTGGRQIQFAISTSLPNSGWVQDDGTAIDLDIVSGSAGVANFVVIRITNDSSAPTDAECISAIGRTPIPGDLCTINYNSGISSIVYKYTTGWAIFQKYITGDLMVANTVTAGNIGVSQLSAISADMGSITAGDISVGTTPAISGTTMTGTGTHLYSNGNIVVGNSTKNLTFDGSIVTINGDLVATGNIVNNAVTNTVTQTNSTTFSLTAPVGARILILVQANATTSFATISPPSYWVSTTISRGGTTLKTYKMSIAYESTNFASMILADATVFVYDTGTGSSETYTATTSSTSPSYDWAAFVLKK